jgi:hypothetical protein
MRMIPSFDLMEDRIVLSNIISIVDIPISTQPGDPEPIDPSRPGDGTGPTPPPGDGTPPSNIPSIPGGPGDPSFY